MTLLFWVLGIFGYLFTGYFLGSAMWREYCDDTPTEDLGIWRKAFRYLTCPAMTFLGDGDSRWKKRFQGSYEQHPLSSSIICLMGLEDSNDRNNEKARKFYINFSIWLWPLCRFFPFLDGLVLIFFSCLTGIVSKISSLILWFLEEISKRVVVFLGDKKNRPLDTMTIFQEELAESRKVLCGLSEKAKEKIALLDTCIARTQKFLSETHHEKEGAGILLKKLMDMRGALFAEVANIESPLQEIADESKKIEERMRLIELYRASKDVVDTRSDESRVLEESIRGMEACRKLMKELSLKKAEAMLDAEITLPEVEQAISEDAKRHTQLEAKIEHRLVN